jgi:predicted ATP-binding protein involved in virulence
MRLTRVHVTKLFGLFDHEIRLNHAQRLTIVHGPNGFGKTIVLRMIEALISGDYALVDQIPFEAFTIESDTGMRLLVEREERSEQQVELGRPHILISAHPLSAPGPLYWSKLTTAASDFEHLLPRSDGTDRRKPVLSSTEPPWAAKARAEFPKVRLINTQRLVEHTGVKRKKALTVQAYSDDLAARLQQKLAEYATRAQELDRNFPTRLLSSIQDQPLTAEALRQRLADLEQKRADLTQLGFLDPEHEPALKEASVQAIETKRDVLAVYVDDMESKLAIFDEMASKIRLFTKIINGRFLLKRLEIHREQGFVFTAATGARLQPSHLSSGEQHELILFYEMLFQMKKDELLLIDEPEISLHVAWQEKFLEDLSEVVKLSEIDVMIATHSPEIIGEHWDLTVELKGPAEPRQG